jgi:DNA repair protein RadA/Sms
MNGRWKSLDACPACGAPVTWQDYPGRTRGAACAGPTPHYLPIEVLRGEAAEPAPTPETPPLLRRVDRSRPDPRLVRSSAPARAPGNGRNGRHADMVAPLPTSLPTLRGSVGSEVATSGALLEASGEELAAAGAAGSAGASLPSLPLLGREGYIIQGWSHLVAGYPRAGKTELLAAQVVDWCRAGRSVLYFSEEPRSIWTVRLARLAAGLAEGDRAALARLAVVFALGSDPEALLTRALRGHEAVVVLDTLRNLLLLRDETDNSEIARALNPWIAAARAAGKTLIVAHHLRKGGGEHGEGIAGGHALLGTFDMALELVRDPQHPDRRLLRAYARLIAPPELVYERDEHGGFRALGEPEALRRAEVMARVRAALTAEWQATAEVHAALDEPRPGKELLRGVLLELARNGEVERDPGIEVERVQGKTVRWRLRVPPRSGPGPVPPHVSTSLPTDVPLVGSEVHEEGSDDRP